MPTPNERVEALLVAALVHHRTALHARQKRLVGAQRSLGVAATLRQQALALDPQRQLPAWRDEERRLRPGIHHELMAFYLRKRAGVSSDQEVTDGQEG